MDEYGSTTNCAWIKPILLSDDKKGLMFELWLHTPLLYLVSVRWFDFDLEMAAM